MTIQKLGLINPFFTQNKYNCLNQAPGHDCLVGRFYRPSPCLRVPQSNGGIHTLNQAILNLTKQKLEGAKKNEAKDKAIAIFKTALQVGCLAAAIFTLSFGFPAVALPLLIVGIVTFLFFQTLYAHLYAGELGNAAFSETGCRFRKIEDLKDNYDSDREQKIGDFKLSIKSKIAAFLFPALHQAYTRVRRLERWTKVFEEQQIKNTTLIPALLPGQRALLETASQR